MLSDTRILQEQGRGNITIEPFHLYHLGPNTYDVRIGNYYYQESHMIANVDLDNPEHLSHLWAGPIYTSGAIPVKPGETILAHTLEKVETKNGIVAMMHSKSTTARCGLSVCRCAGVGDVGYSGHWTMEILNGTKTKIWIPVGWKIAQFSFYDVGETMQEYQGRYGQGAWDPKDMLPKPQTN